MRVQILTGFLAVFAIAIPQALAGKWNQRTRLDINETIAIPGGTLKPGKYVVRLADSPSDRHIVRFLNEDESEVVATILTIPNKKMKASGDTQLAFYETAAGEPMALRAWFYPGDMIGQEFVYSDKQAKELAIKSKRSVPAMSDADAKRLNERSMNSTEAPTFGPDSRIYSRSADDREMTIDEGFMGNYTVDSDPHWQTRQKGYYRYGRFGSMEEKDPKKENK